MACQVNWESKDCPINEMGKKYYPHEERWVSTSNFK